jgi:hypothetical protein
MTERIIAVTLRGDTEAVNEWADYLLGEVRYRLDNDRDMPADVTYWIDGEEPA